MFILPLLKSDAIVDETIAHGRTMFENEGRV